MGVACQVLENMLRPAKRPLGVDDPIVPEQQPEKAAKEFGLGKGPQIAMEAEFLLAEEALQTSTELAAKDAAEYPYRKEEMVFGMNPARVVWGKTAGWNNTVHRGGCACRFCPQV